jgi:maleate isomerase
MSRIGLFVPSSNTTIEPEFYRALPTEVTVHVVRLYLAQIASDSIQNVVLDIAAQARNLASADVDVLVLGATAPSFLKGLGYDREVIAMIEAASGKRATTASTALVDSLRHMGISSLALGSAYDEKVNGIACGFLEASGFNVVSAQGLGLVDNLVVGRLKASTALELARKIDRPDAQAIVLACTNWMSMEVIESIEQALGKPVISTTQCCIWAALRMVGWTKPVMGYGRLLREIGIKVAQ